MYYNNRVQRFGISLRKEQEKQVELKVRQMSDFYRFVESEMLTISSQEPLFDLFNNNMNRKSSGRDFLENYFSSLMTFSDFYEQISIVCFNGNEHIRIIDQGGIPLVVETDILKNISERYYFKRAQELKKGEFYISRFDIDLNRQSIAYPVRPILRILTPIVSNNKILGYLIFNIKGQEFFETLRLIGNEYGWQTYFLNQNGNYIMGPDPLKEWLSFKDSTRAVRFQDEFPGVDIFNNSEEQKTFIDKKGLFTYFRLNQENFTVSDFGKNPMEESWYVVSVISKEDLLKLRSSLFDIKDWGLLAGALVLIMFLSLLVTINVKRRIDYQEQLLLSERELRKANKTKDKFISILAHDLKNPLSSITGFTDILKSDYDSMSQHARDRIIGAMENASLTLLRLIDDVLTWARSQNGSIEVEPEIVFINKVIDDSIKISSLQAAKKEVKITRQCNDEVFAIADQPMIETVLRNLISNAIKFSHRGNEIIVGIEKNHDRKVTVFVRDFGIGITPKMQKELFSLDSVKTTPGTDKETGTGMGLILCKDFIERNGGEIGFYSEEGKGSTFYFTLPGYLEDEA
jgi:signal transduction histidine kinase